MASPGSGGSVDAKSEKAPLAQRIDPTREKLSPAQLQFMRQVQLAQWQKTLPQRRTRNIVTGLGIGALVLAICIHLDCRFGRPHMWAREGTRVGGQCGGGRKSPSSESLTLSQAFNVSYFVI